MLRYVTTLIALIATLSCTGQSNFSLSFPVIYNNVEVTNNFGPKRSIVGDAWGNGLVLSYMLNPNLFRLPKILSLGVGVGYFRQRFNLDRPFHYHSPAEVLYYTRYYSYDSFQASLSIDGTVPLKEKFSLIMGIDYGVFWSFRQKYTPVGNPIPGVPYNQVEHGLFNFGKMISGSIGIKKVWRENFQLP